MQPDTPAPAHTPLLGVLEWFRPGEHDRVDAVADGLRALGITHLRTGFSWADYSTDEGPAWYAWLLPRLARDFDVLPCFTYTPPSLGIEPKTSSPPRTPKDYADFLDLVITGLGDHFEWVELWNEPNNINDWDWRIDPSWEVFSEMMRGAAYWCHERGKKTTLAGMCPTDANWLDLLCRRGVLENIDAVGVHGFPGTWEHDWDDWGEPIGKVRRVLARHDLDREIWITEGGFSTWQHDDLAQLRALVDLAQAPADRVYWYAAQDLAPDRPHQDGFHKDERHYHFGLLRPDGTPKLAYRVLAEGGLSAARDLIALADRHAPCPQPADATGAGASGAPAVHAARTDYALITGGAGFIGTNVADRLLRAGRRVRIFDSLARPGVETNLRWLCATHGDRVDVDLNDVRNPHAVREAVARAGEVYHFAAQVAVTTSVDDPHDDFEVNARGTLNVLEALRLRAAPPPLLFTSTNKVYGDLGGLALRETDARYEPVDPGIRRRGIAESQPLSFHSPYGCSKGAADQYVLDYARVYELPTVVFRMSCMYGPHQFGTEDQGWVAHFLLKALEGGPITLFGDGKQVRDILFVEDLVDAMLLARQRIDDVRGRAFNIGGGPDNAVSLLQLIAHIDELRGAPTPVRFDAWRPGDQRYYVSDTDAFTRATGWQPRIPFREGVERLYAWLVDAEQPVQQLVA